MDRRTCALVVLVWLFCGTVRTEETFSIIPASGPLSGKVKSVGTSDLVFIESSGKERVIPFIDLLPRDIYRCRRQLLKANDAEGLFMLGDYCAKNELPHDAFRMWDAAGKANPREFSNRIKPAWNELVSRLQASENPPQPPSRLSEDELKKLPSKTALRLRVLEAGKPYKFPRIPWEKRSKLETLHYSIETNVPEMTGKYVMLLLEELYKYYGLRLNCAPTGKLRVFIFATREDFEQQASAAGHPVNRNVGGFYLQSSSLSQCAIYMPWVMQGGDDPTSVLMHECFHQFYHRVFGKGEPTWLNEGMATYFEACVFDGEKITDGVINPTRLEALQEMIRQKDVDSLSALLNMDQQMYHAPQYSEGWAFVYWMAWGQADKKERTAMQQRLVAFIRTLKNKKPTRESFEQATGLRVADLDEKWKKWVLSINPDDPFGGNGDPRK